MKVLMFVDQSRKISRTNLDEVWSGASLCPGLTLFTFYIAKLTVPVWVKLRGAASLSEQANASLSADLVFDFFIAFRYLPTKDSTIRMCSITCSDINTFRV